MLKGNTQMSTNAFMYPQWTLLRPVWFEYTEGGDSTMAIEYKYVVSSGGRLGSSGWERIAGNRRLEVPLEPGALWLVTDARFGDISPASIVPTTMAEAKARWASFVPDWMSLPEMVRLHPDRYMLTPRIPLRELGGECHSDIASEAGALSKTDSPRPDEDKSVEELETARYLPSESSSSSSHGFDSRDVADVLVDIPVDTCASGDLIGVAENDDVRIVAGGADDVEDREREAEGHDRREIGVAERESVAADDGRVSRELHNEALSEIARLRAENEELRERLRLATEPQPRDQVAAPAAVADRVVAPCAASVALSVGARAPCIAAAQEAAPSELVQVLRRRRREVDSKAEYFTRETLRGLPPSGRHGGAFAPAARSCSEGLGVC